MGQLITGVKCREVEGCESVHRFLKYVRDFVFSVCFLIALLRKM
jgi:hypothetical protein